MRAVEHGLLRRFRTDMRHFARVALRIQTKHGELVLLDPNRAQQIVNAKIEAQLAERGLVRALILKARQEGISTWIAGRVYRGCTLWKNRNGLVVADEVDRSETLFRIYERYWTWAPSEVRPVRKTARRGREMLFDFPGGGGLDSQIAVETAGDTEAGRSKTRWYLHLSELAYYAHQTESLTALLQTVPDDAGEVYIESTANGVGDEFHNRWLAAEAGESDWLAIFLPWWIHEEYSRPLTPAERPTIEATLDSWEQAALQEGIEWEGALHPLSLEQIAWRRSKIANAFGGDSRLFRQEFPATAEEAFLVSGAGFFDEDALHDYRSRLEPPIMRGHFLRVGQGLVLAKAERGYVRVWEKPDPKLHYVIGADTASGKLSAAHDTGLDDAQAERGGRDFSSADVIEVGSHRQVAQIHGRMAPEVFAEQCELAGIYYACGDRRRRTPALIAPERNHDSGQTVIRWLREHRYPRVFLHRRINKRTEKVSEDYGWLTDGTTRMPMLDELAAEVRAGTVGIRSADTLREMTTFVRADDGRPEAQEGTHDDRVISIAIALQICRQHFHGNTSAPPPVPVEDTPTGL